MAAATKHLTQSNNSSISEIMNRRLIYFICMVSAMGGLLFGYDWVVIGGAKPFYEAYFGISGDPGMQGLAMSERYIHE